SSALCQAGQHQAVTEKGPYVTYNHNRGSFVAILIGFAIATATGCVGLQRASANRASSRLPRAASVSCILAASLLLCALTLNDIGALHSDLDLPVPRTPRSAWLAARLLLAAGLVSLAWRRPSIDSRQRGLRALAPKAASRE